MDPLTLGALAQVRHVRRG